MPGTSVNSGGDLSEYAGGNLARGYLFSLFARFPGLSGPGYSSGEFRPSEGFLGRLRAYFVLKVRRDSRTLSQFGSSCPLAQ